MTLSESLALNDHSHILYHKTYADWNSSLSIRNLPLIKKQRSSFNVQAQIVSKQTYLHQEIKIKMEGKHKRNAHPSL